MNKINELPPFKRLCVTIGNLPSSYVDSMSYYECLMWLCKYLKDTVIPAINENAEAVNELINWFNNLDVQDEIDHKLDEMAESGELQEIISEYLNSKAIFGYDTVSDMKSAENLISGSYARTLGYYTKGDKGGAIYYISDSATANDVDVIELNSGLKAVLVNNEHYLKANQVGVHCDKTTDDTTQLQKVIDYCKENNYELLIDGYAYVSDSIDTKGISIRGLGKRPKPTHTYTSKEYGYIGWDYLRNAGDGALITFTDYVNDMLDFGSGIISDTANPIIKCHTNDGKFILNDLSIVGWLRTEDQVGIKSIYSNDSNTYIDGKHLFNNISVFNCGGDGINLQSLELTHVNNVDVSFNFGYGFYIEEVEDFDCPFEYTTFNECRISGNKLGGIYAKNSFRKNVEFNNCLVNRTGLYRQLGITPPDNFVDMATSIVIDGKSSYVNEPQHNLVIHNCHGEELDCMVKVLNNVSGNVINFIDIHGCTLYPTSNDDIHTIAYIDTYYTKTLNFYNNFIQGTGNLIEFGSNIGNIVPNIVDKVFYDQYNYNPSTSVSSKITVAKKTITRYGNLITVNLNGEANDTIAAYSDIITGLPAPSDTLYFNTKVANNIEILSLYSNGKLQNPSAIANGSKIIISFSYYTTYESTR